MPTPRGPGEPEGSKDPERDLRREEDVERVNRSLEELEDLIDQVILYTDPRYIDESRLGTPEGAAFARKCRDVADYLGTLAVRLGGMLDKAPHVSPDERNEPGAGDVGGQ